MEKSTFIICTIIGLIICALISAGSIVLGLWLAPGYILYKAVKALLGFTVGVVVILILSIAYRIVNR